MNREMAALYARRAEAMEKEIAEGQVEPAREEQERLRDPFTHLSAAAAELRNALRAALDGDAPASVIHKTAQALADVSSLIPWAITHAKDTETGFTITLTDDEESLPTPPTPAVAPPQLGGLLQD